MAGSYQVRNLQIYSTILKIKWNKKKHHYYIKIFKGGEEDG